ncbi:hypothetical protein MKK69_21665 [Methylobacterium sp. J-026]|uniref:hypothetical protein n=1 Tax=Methylobacterium sp. J-026 TaxID=2836624 RepID=UPI001FB8A753|nr:hypothetical protein [Methylobacterium sp. J-026]MCJ2136621.1 hypothetical protein [Methylobacterium sp. J-026]
MEHYRSTVATTAIAALGLLVAAHVLHPGNYERSDRSARIVTVAMAAPSTATIWTDAPQRLLGSEPAALMADSEALLARHPTVAPPPGARTLPRLSGALVPPVAQKAADGDPIGDLIRDLDIGDAS